MEFKLSHSYAKCLMRKNDV